MIPQMIKVADSLYKVLRVVNFSESIDVQAWKEWLGATHSFRRENQLFFVEEIPVLEFEDIKTI